MCGEDGTQRGVYKLKEEHEDGGSKQKEEEREEQRERKRKARVERKSCLDH